eukprot:RCo033015
MERNYSAEVSLYSLLQVNECGMEAKERERDTTLEFRHDNYKESQGPNFKENNNSQEIMPGEGIAKVTHTHTSCKRYGIAGGVFCLQRAFQYPPAVWPLLGVWITPLLLSGGS